MTTTTITHPTTQHSAKRGYHFDNLAVIDCLEIVANDPAFLAISCALPSIGQETKPALTTTPGFMLLGIATVLFGGDDHATAELRAQWPRFRKVCAAVGVPTPEQPMNAQHFRDFRDKFLARKDGLAAMNEKIKLFVRAAAIGQANQMGLLEGCDWNVDGDPDGWFGIPHERVLIGDGTWMAEMYEKVAPEQHTRKNQGSKKTRIPRHTRSKNRVRRVTPDADHKGNAHGYEHMFLSVRSKGKHKAIVLDIERCPKGEEMGVLTTALRRLREALPDVDLGLVYDGAMVGKYHTLYREELGLLTINQAPGADGKAYHRSVDRPRPKTSTDRHDCVVEFTAGDGTICAQTLELLAGVLFRVKNGNIAGGTQRLATMEHVEIRRLGTRGAYRWDLDIEFFCSEHGEHHRTTIDPNGTWGPLALADKLRMVPANHERYPELYGLRNFSESLNRYIKGVLMRTNRARSTTAERHELDLILAIMTHNALAWAEHGCDRYRALAGR